MLTQPQSLVLITGSWNATLTGGKSYWWSRCRHENDGQWDECCRGVGFCWRKITGKHPGYGSSVVGRRERIRTFDACLPNALSRPLCFNDLLINTENNSHLVSFPIRPNHPEFWGEQIRWVLAPPWTRELSWNAGRWWPGRSSMNLTGQGDRSSTYFSTSPSFRPRRLHPLSFRLLRQSQPQPSALHSLPPPYLLWRLLSLLRQFLTPHLSTCASPLPMLLGIKLAHVNLSHRHWRNRMWTENYHWRVNRESHFQTWPWWLADVDKLIR